MKKIFLMFLLTTVILSPAIQAQAADVPGFYQFGGRHLTFTGKEGTGNGYRVYGYDCSVDLNENFAERFMNSLGNFRLTGHYVNDYVKVNAKFRETWVFTYTGSKNVSRFIQKDYGRRQNYNAHLVVAKVKNWQTDITHFSIRVAYGLTYGED